MMQRTIEQIIPLLVKGKPMAYALKADGRLVVIDANGQKRTFERAAYKALLTPDPPVKPNPSPTHPRPASKTKPATDKDTGGAQ